METVSYQLISDAKPTEIITACEDSDTCPGCGAGYRVGLSACEYCRRPVRLATGGPHHGDRKLIGEAADDRLLPYGIGHTGEIVIPASVAESLRGYYERLYDEAEAG